MAWRKEKEGEYEWVSYSQMFEKIQNFGSGLRKFCEPVCYFNFFIIIILYY